ncbi:MAG: hypothetical protein AABX51_01385 [Nanoarchaeota archaeon]
MKLFNEAGIKKTQAIILSSDDIERAEEYAKQEKCDLIELTTDNPLIDFEGRGYFFRPRKITYKMLVPESEEVYLSSLGRNKRKGIIRAIKACKDSGIEIRTEEPVSKETFLEWERIYDVNILKKRIGLKRIGPDRFSILQPRTAGVFAYKQGKIIGGILLTHKRFLMNGEMLKKLSISLSSTDRQFFMYGVNEALNFEVIRYCQLNGIKYLERGMDTNFYGHYLNPGLYTFKKSLGYRITTKPKYGFCWTKILNFEKFEDHIFFISIGDNGLEGNLFFKESLPNINEFTTPFLKKINLFSVSDNKIIPFELQHLSPLTVKSL